MAIGEFKELSVSEMEQLDPTQRQEYLRRKAARDAMSTQESLRQGAEASAAAAKMMPEQIKSQLATSAMGLAGGGLAQGLAALGPLAKQITPAATMATQQGLATAAQQKADADVAGVDAATYLAEQGVGSKSANKRDVKSKIEGIKKDLRNWLTGIDADALAREIENLKEFYADDAGNIDPDILAYIDKQKRVEVEAASGWDIA